MQFRRVLAGGRLEHQSATPDGKWEALASPPLGASPFAPDFETALAERHHAASGNCLPFQPLSFRDFMLSEQHVVDASRGLVSRFAPAQARATRVYEAATRRAFPLFKPHRLFQRQPIYYMSNHVSFVPSGTPVRAPSYSTALDYELELGFVLRSELRDATAEAATDAIGAFVLVNDFSARDVQRTEMASGLGPQKSKHFLSSMSDTAVTPHDILADPTGVTGSVAINGKTVSRVDSTGLRWSLGEVLAHASRSETLLPGELFATGTLAGGSGMESGNWVVPGDVLTLTLDHIGSVEHRIEAAPAGN